jgi:sugar phosphate isomerase/epimerase
MKKILLLLLTAVCAQAAAPWVDHLGIQLWSLHKELEKDPKGGLDHIKSFGLTYVETAGTYNLSVADFKAELAKRDLKPVSAHFGYERLTSDLAGAIAEAKQLGVKYVVVPWIPHEGKFTVDAATKVAADFDRWGAAFRKEGLIFGWHPHGFEFAKGAKGESPFDFIVRSTDPKNLALEMDVFWVFHAGADPVALLKQLGDRWKLLHVKDLRKGATTGHDTGSAPDTDNVAVGSGQIDWNAVLSAAKDAGVAYYFIEDETPDPGSNVPVSIKYLRALK